MSTEDSSGMDDVEQSLEPAHEQEEKSGLMERLSDFKESYVDFHTVEEESEEWGDQPAAGNVSRRGFLSLAGQVAVAGYGVAEATDNDGWAVDFESGGATGEGPLTGQPGANGQNGQTPDGIGTVGDVSDELYVQEDGDVIAIDHGHKEWRAFRTEEFPKNEDYQDMHADLSETRDPSMLPPPGVDQGIEVTKQELLNHSSSAYDDMADESEWDLIFDSNPNYNGGA